MFFIFISLEKTLHIFKIRYCVHKKKDASLRNEQKSKNRQKIEALTLSQYFLMLAIWLLLAYGPAGGAYGAMNACTFVSA
jgi:hypothetical protein